MSAEKPSPNKVKASPDATWFARKNCVKIAKINESAAPPKIEAKTPRVGLPVSTDTAKPQIAPVIIIPSTPKFNTPARSTTNSPIAANMIGVEAIIRLAISRAGLIVEVSI
jgi:hypothetical protein